jgi:hypothetical protein
MRSAARITRPLQSPLSPAISSLPVRRFSLDEYHHLIEIGFLTEHDKVELLNGWIVSKMPINPPHASAVGRVARRLELVLGHDWLVRQQSSVSIPSSDSEPEPDVVVVPGPEETFDARHPYPADIAILVEVADSSLREDQGEKKQTYAAAKINVYWIINLVDRRVEVYSQPRGGKNPTYRTRADYAAGQSVPVTIGGKKLGTVKVNDLLP